MRKRGKEAERQRGRAAKTGKRVKVEEQMELERERGRKSPPCMYAPYPGQAGRRPFAAPDRRGRRPRAQAARDCLGRTDQRQVTCPRRARVARVTCVSRAGALGGPARDNPSAGLHPFIRLLHCVLARVIGRAARTDRIFRRLCSRGRSGRCTPP